MPEKKGQPLEPMPVARAISDLRAQLIAAADDAQGKAIEFKITSVELELQLVLTSEVSANGKLGWGVLSFGGGAKAGDSKTHSLKLTMAVTGPGGGPAPAISGPEGEEPVAG